LQFIQGEGSNISDIGIDLPIRRPSKLTYTNEKNERKVVKEVGKKN
jgi:hypothetical protein